MAENHFIVFVPGYMGSRLKDNNGNLVWIDFKGILTSPGRWVDKVLGGMSMENELVPDGVVNEVMVIKPWIKQGAYSDILDELEGWGYDIDPTNPDADDMAVYTFPYDWRQDNRDSGRKLAQSVDGWRENHPGAKVWIIGHSNGGIVARWYIEKEGGKEHVSRLFLLGSPRDGAPKALKMVHTGLEVFFRRLFNPFGITDKTRDLLRTFPSAYQILPVENPFLQDVNNNVIDIYDDTSWLDNDEQRALLADGKAFTESLGTTLSVETYCFFGRKQATVSGGILKRTGLKWDGIEWHELEAGDGTVPERSAIHPEALFKYPFVTDHGGIFSDQQVLTFLQWELIDKFKEGLRAILITDSLHINFAPDKDLFEPDEEIVLTTTLTKLVDGEPHRDATVVAKLLWKGALPGSAENGRPAASDEVSLKLIDADAGTYRAVIRAPAQSGYYQLLASIKVPEQATTIRLTELIVVEELPTG